MSSVNCQVILIYSLYTFQWKTVRLKNTRIFDAASFIRFITFRRSQIVDFRKMLHGTIDWTALFVELGQMETLHSVVLGPRRSELLPLLWDKCPHVQVLPH